MAFKNFALNETILANLEGMGFTGPTQIQSDIMPIALGGGDVSGLSRTGTGKTAAFLVPTLQRLSELPPDRLALCLAPTRELAQQIMEEANKIGKGLGFGSVSVVGGMSSEDQIRALKDGARLITGTPGRVIDLFKERALDLSRVDVLVFDEADRMFDMGFIKDMHYILSKVNPKRQILLFSATMNFSVLNMVYEYGANPQEINVSRDQMTADKIQQVLFHVGDKEKPAALLTMFKKYAGDNGTAVVFVNYKERVPWVAAMLTKNGIPAQGLSSLLRQEKRNKIIQGFKAGAYRALVATDVASRGLDVDNVSLVVNYHLPEEAPTYVHRIGRTARAGKHGIAVSICSSEDAYSQMRVEEFLGSKIPVEWLGEDELVKDVKFPRREEEDHDGEEEGEEGSGPRGRGGRDRGGDRGGRGRSSSGPSSRGPREPREARPPREPREAREPRELRPVVTESSGPSASADLSADQLADKMNAHAAPSTEGQDDRTREPRRDRSDRPVMRADRPQRVDRSEPRAEENTDAAPVSDRPIPRAEGEDRPVPRHARGDRPIPRTEGSEPAEVRSDRPIPRPEGSEPLPVRADRPERSGEGRDRNGGRERGGRGRDRNDRGGRGRDRGDRDNRGDRDARFGEEGRKAPSDIPNPLVGNPVIYDMTTGKPKNRTADEFKKMTSKHDTLVKAASQAGGRKKAAPALIKKISSRVTALFGKANPKE